MDDLYQIDIKIFTSQGDDIAPFDFVPVLQRWIQEHTVPGVLIDVADYSHIHHGAGVILVAHEMNISIDYNGGRMGLLYHQKQPREDSFAERLRAVLNDALTACKLLQEEPEFQGRLAFDPGNLLFLASDRLTAPNDEAVSSTLRKEVSEALISIYGEDVRCESVATDSRDRVAFAITSPKSPMIDDLVAR
jgi:hypothetical protein